MPRRRKKRPGWIPIAVVRANREAFRKYKSTLSCTDCSMSFATSPECCDFHHKDPKTKLSEVSILASYPRDIWMPEVRKCIPLCANCHRTRHRKE